MFVEDMITKDATKSRKSTVRKDQLAPVVLRRSTRKRSIPSTFNSVFSSPPPSAKKARKKLVSPPFNPPTLLSLPYCAISKLLQCLDVDSLENLSSTCYYFDQLIAGRFLLSIDFPFPVSFLHEVNNSKMLEKKPLLRFRCKKSIVEFMMFSNVYPEPFSQHKLIIDNEKLHMRDYLVMSQMSLLSLHKLREVDLVPHEDNIRLLSQRNLDLYTKFDCSVLKQISRLGSLSHVTKLDVLVDQYLYLEELFSNLPNLLELGLTIHTRNGLSKHAYMTEYLPCLEAVVASSKAPILKVTAVNEPKRKVTKVFKNSHVEKLIVTGPCTFNVFLMMEKLKEVEVNMKPSNLASGNNCTFWKSKVDDRRLHRAGLCCVDIGAVYQNCPKLEKFMGVDVGSISQNQSFIKWNTKVKKRFYEYYLSQGGLLEMKPWAKTRWFSRRLVLP